MEVLRINFPPILKDNEETYFRYLEGIISSVDYEASLQLTRRESGIAIRISPSEPMAFDNILTEIKKFHTLFGIRVNFSKSMKLGNNISFYFDF